MDTIKKNIRLFVGLLFIVVTLTAKAQTYKIGDIIINEDGSKGVVFYVDPLGYGGWMVALNDASAGCAWGTSDDIPNLPNKNTNFFQTLLLERDGYECTRKIRQFQGNSNQYAAGKTDFGHGWYLPAAGQLRVLVSNMALIEGKLTENGGTALLPRRNYWSSTENDSLTAWCVRFNADGHGGHYYNLPKDNTDCAVRAIRDFDYGALILIDSTLHYQWNTGDTTAIINVSPATTTTYSITAFTDFGCSNSTDQIIIVNPSGDIELYDTICVGEPYKNYGFNLTASQTQESGETLFNRTIGTADCFTTLNLHLFKENTLATDTISDCHCDNEPYYFHGTPYNGAGTFTHHFNAVTVCDSTETLVLSELPSSDSSFRVSICNSYVWNGILYSESGIYFQSFKNQHGCDSTVMLNLNIMPTPSSSIEGQTQVYAATDLVTGIYNYHIDSISQPYTSVIWLIDNDQWILHPHGASCQVIATTPHSATLTVIIENDGCLSESTLTLNATYFDLDEQNGELVSIYPNPANSMINIDGEGIQEIKIYNMLGQNILSWQGDGSNHIQIETGDMGASIYLMEIETRRGKAIERIAVVK